MKQSLPRRLLRVLLWLAAIGLCCYAALVALVYHWEVSVPTPSDYDSIIVLGAQVLPDGSPSVQLRWRLDKAVEYYQKSPCPIVACGGRGGQEPAPEGDVMRKLLLQDGLSEQDVYAESTSADTRQNIQNAWDILQELGCRRPLLVTSDYHLPRAMALARDTGLTAVQGVGSPCRSEAGYWLKNHMREALAWIKYWLVKYLRLPL